MNHSVKKGDVLLFQNIDQHEYQTTGVYQTSSLKIIMHDYSSDVSTSLRNYLITYAILIEIALFIEVL